MKFGAWVFAYIESLEQENEDLRDEVARLNKAVGAQIDARLREAETRAGSTLALILSGALVKPQAASPEVTEGSSS